MASILARFSSSMGLSGGSGLHPVTVLSPLHELGVGERVDVGQGGHLSEEVVADSDTPDLLEVDGLVVDLDSSPDLADHLDDLVVDQELLLAVGVAQVDHSGTEDGGGSSQAGGQAGHGLLESGLDSGLLGVGCASGDHARDVVVLGQLGAGGGEHSDLGGSDGCGGVDVGVRTISVHEGSY